MFFSGHGVNRFVQDLKLKAIKDLKSPPTIVLLRGKYNEFNSSKILDPDAETWNHGQTSPPKCEWFVLKHFPAVCKASLKSDHNLLSQKRTVKNSKKKLDRHENLITFF